MSRNTMLRYNGAGTLTFVEDGARRTVTSAETFEVPSGLAEVLLGSDPNVVVASTEGGYGSMSVPALRGLAESRGIEFSSRATKATLVDLLEAADERDEDASEGEGTEPKPSDDQALVDLVTYLGSAAAADRDREKVTEMVTALSEESKKAFAEEFEIEADTEEAAIEALVDELVDVDAQTSTEVVVEAGKGSDKPPDTGAESGKGSAGAITLKDMPDSAKVKG